MHFGAGLGGDPLGSKLHPSPRPAPQIPYVPLELGLEQLFQELAGDVSLGEQG